MAGLDRHLAYVLGHEEAWSLLTLLDRGSVHRYEETRKALGMHPQAFQRLLRRLRDSGLVRTRATRVPSLHKGAIPVHLLISQRGRVMLAILRDLEQGIQERRAELGMGIAGESTLHLHPVPAEVTRQGRRTMTGYPPRALLARITRRIVETAHPQKVILFGSAARGQMGPDSDLDFLVIKPGITRRRDEARRIRRALHGIALGTPKDVIVVTPRDVTRYGDTIGFVLRPALREGRILYVAT